jgi:3-oxoacyl-[acyl-carrier protein] reductase
MLNKTGGEAQYASRKCMKSIDLKGKVAVVTGGSGELGRKIVAGLAECGADVVITYHKQGDFADKLRQEIEHLYEIRAIAIQTDITSLDSVLAMKLEANLRLGIVDIIVNNAVIQYQWKSVLDQDLECFTSQFNSSVMQCVLMAKAFAPDMKAQRFGRIIGINTECTMQMFPLQSAYVAGKRGMDGVYRVLARELGEYEITVNQIAPGWIISDRFRDADGTERNTGQDFAYIDRVPMKRRASDDDIANSVCFLASDLARSITGVYLPVCCGNVMPCV